MINIRRFFYWSLGLDLGYLVGNGVFMAVKQILGTLSGLALVYFFTNFASQSDFGIYNMVISVFGVISAISLSGIGTSLTRSIASGYDSSYVVAINLKTKFSFAGSFILFFLFLFYLNRSQESLAFSFLILALLFPIISRYSSYPYVLVAKKNFKKHAIYSSVSQVVIVFSLILAIIFGLNIIYILFLYFFLNTILNFIFHNKVIKLLKNLVIDKDFKSFTYFMSIIAGLALTAQHLDKVILGSLNDLSTLAIYSLALTIPESLNTNLKTFMGIFTVKLIKKKDEEKKEIFKKFYLRLIFLGVVLAASFWMIIPFFIRYFFPESYKEAIFYSQLLSLALIFSPLVIALSSSVTYSGNYKHTLFFNIFPIIVRLVIYIALIPLYGIFGAVVALITERLLSAVVLTYLVFKR